MEFQFDPRTAALESWTYVLASVRRELENSYPDHAEITDQQLIQICRRLHPLLVLAEHGELMTLSSWMLLSLPFRGLRLVFAPAPGPLHVLDVELAQTFGGFG